MITKQYSLKYKNGATNSFVRYLGNETKIQYCFGIYIQYIVRQKSAFCFFIYVSPVHNKTERESERERGRERDKKKRKEDVVSSGEV